MRKIISLIGFLLLVFLIAGISSYVTIPETSKNLQSSEICDLSMQGCENVSSNTWYGQLNKPSWQPPAYVFGPVWTILYIMIAVAGWIVWQKLPTEKFSHKLTSLIMAPYWLQLALNFLWSIFFFTMHQPLWSLIDIIMMVIVIGMNIGTFSKVSKPAAYLLVPYFLWVCYATSLNAAIVSLN